MLLSHSFFFPASFPRSSVAPDYPGDNKRAEKWLRLVTIPNSLAPSSHLVFQKSSITHALCLCLNKHTLPGGDFLSPSNGPCGARGVGDVEKILSVSREDSDHSYTRRKWNIIRCWCPQKLNQTRPARRAGASFDAGQIGFKVEFSARI